jgi:hypothetical protein
VDGAVGAATGRLTLPVPAGPGMGPPPDRAFLESVTTRRVVVQAPDA